eukprot:4838015-Ditylum_brightwellii.AAC.1
MTIFRNSKETVTKIGHIREINLTRIYCVACQEQLNKALAVVASEVDNEDKTYFKNYRALWEIANFDVQLNPSKPSIIISPNHVETSTLAVYALQSCSRISQELMLRAVPYVDNHRFKFLPANLPYNKSIRDGKQNYAQLLKEENQYLSNYKDFRISSINKDLLDKKIDDSTLRGKQELADVIGDIMPTVFTKVKGIWKVKTTKLQVVEAMRNVTEVLDNIQDKISERYKTLFSAFPCPRVLNTSCVLVQYAKSLVSDV